MLIADDDPSVPTIQKFCNASLPLFLPKPPQLVRLGTGFDSSLVGGSSSPWKPGIFNLSSIDKAAARAEIDAAQHSYRSSFTFSSRNSSEHFSGSLGISIGNDFLSGSVSGSYDKSVKELTEGTQSSRVASCDIGRVMINVDGADLKNSSHVTLRDQHFRKEHGDYFLVGYSLGVERGVNLHINSHSRSEKESKEITVKVKVLCFEKSHTWRESMEKLSSEFNITITGFDTLEHRFDSLASQQARDTDALTSVFRYYESAVDRIQRDVEERLQILRVKDGQAISLVDCDRLYHSGLVRQLFLLPYSTIA